MSTTMDTDLRLPLCQELIDNIVDQSSTDFPTLAVLCLVSRSCANISRKHLYRELDLVSGSSRLDKSRFHSSPWRDGQGNAVLKNSCLWIYIQSLVVTLESVRQRSSVQSHFLPFLLVAVQFPHLERLHLQLGREDELLKDHFPILDPIRPTLQLLLASSKLKSLSVDIFTAGAINHSQFPGWIFKDLPDSVKELHLTIRYASWVEGHSLLYFGGQVPHRQLETFSLNILNHDDTMARCAAILSGKFFDLNLTRLKSLTITHIHRDETLWTLPDQTAETLEELTILDFPGEEHFLRPNHFVDYRVLRTLNFSIAFDSKYPPRSTCTLLVELFSQQLPPTLSRVSIQLMLGHVRNEYDVPKLELGRTESWKDLLKVLCTRPSISSLAIHLSWTCSTRAKPYWLSDSEQYYPLEQLEEQKQEERKKREKWEGDTQDLLEKWRQVFQGAGERNIELYLNYSREYRTRRY